MEQHAVSAFEIAQEQIDLRVLLDLEIVLVGGGAEVVSFY